VHQNTTPDPRLRNCHRLMAISCNHPIQKSESRSGNASAKLQNDARRRLCCWWRGNGNSVVRLLVGRG
jgi:hypothetical protein